MKSMSQRCLILCEKEQEMERLTSNKPVADMMPMIELAHNSCYIVKNTMQDIGIMSRILTQRAR